MRVLLPAISAGRSAGSSGFRTCAGAGAGAWIRQTRLSSVRNRTGERAARSARSRSNGRVSVGQSGWRPAEPSSSGSRPPSRSLESGRSRRAGSFSGFGAGGRSAGSLGLDRSRIDYLHCRQPLGTVPSSPLPRGGGGAPNHLVPACGDQPAANIPHSCISDLALPVSAHPAILDFRPAHPALAPTIGAAEPEDLVPELHLQRAARHPPAMPAAYPAEGAVEEEHARPGRRFLNVAPPRRRRLRVSRYSSSSSASAPAATAAWLIPCSANWVSALSVASSSARFCWSSSAALRSPRSWAYVTRQP
jgi:hypothetical protein